MLPEKVYVKWSEIVNGGIGITDYDFRKVCDAGLLKRFVLPGCTYGKYKRREVLKVFGIKEGDGK